jgi:uncharacterized short protein YbdD (DUF466 family)
MSTNLLGTFDQAINLFNAADYNNLFNLLHPKVIMKKVDDNAQYVIGLPDVKTYFNALNDKPQFHDKTIMTSRAWFDKTVARIRGTGMWEDKTVPAASGFLPVNYLFVFSRQVVADPWLIFIMWAELI